MAEASSKSGISLMSVFYFLFFPEHPYQNNTAVIFTSITAVVGAALLFIVVLVLFLRRRSVTPLLMQPAAALPVCLSVLLISQTAPSAGFLFHSFAFPLWGLQMAFAFTLSSPLSFSLPLANFLFLFIWICVRALTREEFLLKAPCHCSMVIF